MSSWEGKTRGGILGYRIFVFTIKVFGLSGAYFLLVFVAFYYFLFSGKTNKYIYSYFRDILKLTQCKSWFNIYRNYYKLGQVLIDKVAVMAGFVNKFSYDFDGEHYLAEMKDGGLLISAHAGNWELAGNLLNRLDRRFNIVMYDDEHQKIKVFLDEILVDKNIRIIVIKDDLSHLIEIKKALDNKELIAIHGDRFLEGSKTITARFLGEDAKFPEGPFYLALRFNAPVSFVFAMKESRWHYHFYATPSKRYEVDNSRKIDEQSLKQIVTEYVASLEKILSRYPVQWFNYYDFWGKQL